MVLPGDFVCWLDSRRIGLLVLGLDGLGYFVRRAVECVFDFRRVEDGAFATTRPRDGCLGPVIKAPGAVDSAHRSGADTSC